MIEGNYFKESCLPEKSVFKNTLTTLSYKFFINGEPRVRVHFITGWCSLIKLFHVLFTLRTFIKVLIMYLLKVQS